MLLMLYMKFVKSKVCIYKLSNIKYLVLQNIHHSLYITVVNTILILNVYLQEPQVEP